MVNLYEADWPPVHGRERYHKAYCTRDSDTKSGYFPGSSDRVCSLDVDQATARLAGCVQSICHLFNGQHLIGIICRLRRIQSSRYEIGLQMQRNLASEMTYTSLVRISLMETSDVIKHLTAYTFP